jgi:hypothetical protein
VIDVIPEGEKQEIDERVSEVCQRIFSKRPHQHRSTPAQDAFDDLVLLADIALSLRKLAQR